MRDDANSTSEEPGGQSGAIWSERCAALFEDLRTPARAMVSRAYRTLGREEIDDIYSAAWTSSLAALRGRESELDDEELRRYLLAAVAGHASKEMRRRSRRPAGSLDSEIFDDPVDIHQAGTEERVLEREGGGIARDLLSSLPERRRAVMLLRFGWGLKPKEVCALVDGLSPRAYRKEVSKGIDELIDRFGQLESGEWCRSRRGLLRDHIAGTGDQDAQRQAREHLAHCLPCRSFVRDVDTDLRALDGIGLLAGTVLAGTSLSPLDRAEELVDRARDAALDLVGRGGAKVTEALGPTAISSGTRGAGTVGAGALAKFAGLGMAGKAAVACFGAGAAATVCVAAGILPAPLAPQREDGKEEPAGKVEVVADRTGSPPAPIDGKLTPSPTLDDYEPTPPTPPPQPAPAPAPEPEPEPVVEAETATVDPVVREFDPLTPVASPSSTTIAAEPASGSGTSTGTSAGEQEFGP